MSWGNLISIGLPIALLVVAIALLVVVFRPLPRRIEEDPPIADPNSTE